MNIYIVVLFPTSIIFHLNTSILKIYLSIYLYTESSVWFLVLPDQWKVAWDFVYRYLWSHLPSGLHNPTQEDENDFQVSIADAKSE